MAKHQDGEVVAQGVIEVPYVITAWTVDGETVYDWYDSDVFYPSIEEAVLAFRDSVGG